jgi:DNA-binding response OmpR family regulator
MGQRVLVVDDDPTVSDVVRRYLEREGLTVELAGDGQQALDAYDAERPDLVVLDLMLPGIDGLEVCRRLRAHDRSLPVIMLTALGEESDRVLGLELGADDYITKPFSPRELVLRVQSVLRRAVPIMLEDVFVDGDLRVDAARRTVVLRGRELALTVREFDLLVFLMRNPGRVLRRA